MNITDLKHNFHIKTWRYIIALLDVYLSNWHCSMRLDQMKPVLLHYNYNPFIVKAYSYTQPLYTHA